MDKFINEIENTRKLFNIEKFPGDIFSRLVGDNCIERYRIVILKLDLGKELSGFISYSKDKSMTVICVNYKMTVGHQNFTLAHELGHLALHRNQMFEDTQDNLDSNFGKEQEANIFACELLYPETCVKEDWSKNKVNKLIIDKKFKELADLVNELSQKYYTSFDFTLRRLISEPIGSYKTVESIIKKVKASIGSITQKYPGYFYNSNVPHDSYNRSVPIEYLENVLNKLTNSRLIGSESAEEYRYSLESLGEVD